MASVTVEQIARLCHALNREWAEQNDDLLQLDWDALDPAVQRGAKDAIQLVVSHPYMISGVYLHDTWSASRRADGWVYGPEKSYIEKTHPCLVGYHELPAEQRIKDDLFLAVIRCMVEIPDLVIEQEGNNGDGA